MLKALRAQGLLTDFLELSRTLAWRKRTIELPAFDVMGSRSVRPYEWLIPVPRVSVPEFLALYEKFADRPLGIYDRPGEVAAGIYNTGLGVKLMTWRTEADQWLTPASILVAAAMRLGGELEVSSQSVIRVRLGPGLLEVSRWGCWSSNRRAIYPCAGDPCDIKWLATAVPKCRTTNNYLRAYVEVLKDLDTSLTWAATVVAHALNEELITVKDLDLDVEDMANAELAQEEWTDGRYGRANLALQQALEILEQCQVGAVKDLYSAVVPHLMSSRQFQRSFGSVSQVLSRKRIHSGTIGRWRTRLQEALEGHENADI